MVVFLIFAGCKKNQAGGDSEISGVVAHHSQTIPNATVYIKYNAKEFPGKDSSVYDTSVKCDAEGFYTFKCYKGDYYLYATGLDKSSPPDYVKGGAPVSIRKNEKVRADLAVTEAH